MEAATGLVHAIRGGVAFFPPPSPMIEAEGVERPSTPLCRAPLPYFGDWGDFGEIATTRPCESICVWTISPSLT